MRTRFDQFSKQMVSAALDGHDVVETDAEVPAEARRVDLWFRPRDAHTTGPDHLGLLGRISARSGTFEFFHNTPSGDELTACVIKHGEFCHFLSRRPTLPPVPIQWVISSGRPRQGIEGLGFHLVTGWPTGIYESPPLLRTRLVVVNELPVVRDTLLIRLLGSGASLRRAIAELVALPEDAPERQLALPILVGFRLLMPSDPAMQTSDDQELLMNMRDLAYAWRQEAVEEGVKLGLEQSLERERKLVLRLLQQRFGDQVDAETRHRVAAASADQLEVWTERVLSAGTIGELLAE